MQQNEDKTLGFHILSISILSMTFCGEGIVICQTPFKTSSNLALLIVSQTSRPLLSKMKG